MAEPTVVDERLALLGQIHIVRKRLDTLEANLSSLPVGYAYRDKTFENDQGNLSFQVGVLMGRLSRYRDFLK